MDEQDNQDFWSDGINELRTIAEENVHYFERKENESCKKIYYKFQQILSSIEIIEALLMEINSTIDDYDIDATIKANGYRTFLKITNILVNKTNNLAKDIASNRSSYFFRREHYLKEISAYSDGLKSISILLKYLKLLMSWCGNGELFPGEQHSSEELLLSFNEQVNQNCFYGRCLGFQFCDSMATILKGLCTLMASFSEMYYCDGRLIDPLLKCSKYLIDPELRAKRIVNISKYSSAEFCKNFWFLGEMELMQRLPSIVNPSLSVNRVISFEPQTLAVLNNNGITVNIPVPSAHLGSTTLSVRLISASTRLGMETIQGASSSPAIKYPSPNLIIHCHGGGFVAQSSRSHETYLRQWAIELDCPILSIDYSLAPEAPYPRALEEAFYAYCWALENVSSLGSTGERIILAGDSAGANINIGVTMMTIDYGVRQPDGLFLAYVPIILSFAPSPSRLLCFMDPLLPLGFLMGCCKAYACSSEVYKKSIKHERKLRSSFQPKNNDSPTTKVKNGSDEVNGMANNVKEENGVEASEKPALCSLKESKSNYSLLSRMVNSFSSKFPYLAAAKYKPEEECSGSESPEEDDDLPLPRDMIHFEVPKDPYISPFYAKDEVLIRFPETTLLTTELDPFLDDCVVFAKKLRKNGNTAKLVVLPGLSHGFLNFSMLSNEAYEGSKICVQCIHELLQAEKGEECI